MAVSAMGGHLFKGRQVDESWVAFCVGPVVSLPLYRARSRSSSALLPSVGGVGCPEIRADEYEDTAA